MRSLNEIITMYLDYAERQARRGNIMYMRDWVARLDAFLQFNEEDVLHHGGFDSPLIRCKMCVVQRVHLRVVLVGSYILHPGVHVVFLFWRCCTSYCNIPSCLLLTRFLLQPFCQSLS